MLNFYKYLPKIFNDSRGNFRESINIRQLKKNGINFKFKQQNIVYSQKNVLRGLHFQIKPKAQSKIITVLSGSIFDVVVDLRKKSKYYGKYFTFLLSASNKYVLYIPKGFAHGYISLNKETIVVYNVDEYYYPELQKTIKWDDQNLAIEWPKSKNLIISKKDKNGNEFKKNKLYF